MINKYQQIIDSKQLFTKLFNVFMTTMIIYTKVTVKACGSIF